MSNVTALPGCRTLTTGQPNDALVRMFRDMLAKAESGELQAFVGTGITSDSHVVNVWGDFSDSPYQMLGAISWLKAEFIHRNRQVFD